MNFFSKRGKIHSFLRIWTYLLILNVLCSEPCYRFSLYLLELDQIDPKIRGLPRLQKALGNVGGSITMTTLTDMVAFAVSSSIDFPSIRLFCIYASVCLFLSYVLVVSLLVAYISLDIKRIESGCFDLIPCKKKEGYEPWQRSKDTLLNKVSQF